jgi:hypothetical protein
MAASSRALTRLENSIVDKYIDTMCSILWFSSTLLAAPLQSVDLRWKLSIPFKYYISTLILLTMPLNSNKKKTQKTKNTKHKNKKHKKKNKNTK